MTSSVQVAATRRYAEESFASGLFCAESVVLALAKAQGIDSELVPKIATAFCSGMGRSGGACGALTGAVMGVSLALGRSDAGGDTQPSYAAAQRLTREFEQAFGSCHCHLLLGCDLATPEGQAMFRAKRLARQCARYTGGAAEMAARIIESTSSQPG